MDLVKLISINDFCKQEGISRSTFYRKLKKEEIEVYKVPCSERLWLVPHKSKPQPINDSSILEDIERENEEIAEFFSKVI